MTRARATPIPVRIGSITAHSAFLWALFVDAAHVHEWDVEDEPKAFQLVEKRAAKRVVTVGRTRGIVAEISTAGRAQIWKVTNGIVMCAFFPAKELRLSTRADFAKVAKHVVTAPTVGKPRVLGEVQITSGALAMLVPYVEPKTTPALVAKAAKASTVTAGDGLALVPLPRGSYEIVSESLGEYDVDEGLFEARTWVVQKGTFRKTVATAPKPAKTPKARDAFPHRKTTYTNRSLSVLYVRKEKDGTKSFVLLTGRGRELSIESGTWGEKAPRTKKTYASSADSKAALAKERQSLGRKRFRQLGLGETV